MMEEFWKDIEGYEGIYQVSNLGRVRSLPRKAYRFDSRLGVETSYSIPGKIKAQYIEKHGYKCIGLSSGGRKSTKIYLVHRLVAKAFIPNPEGLPFINHKDENKQNNCVDNLEWCDNDYNIHYGTGIARRSVNQQKQIEQIDMQGNVVAVHDGIVKASEATGISRSNIGKCCKGISRHKTAGGYRWRYKE
jgi:hypothetical protein